MVDGLFVSNLVGMEALSAINLTAPAIALITAISGMLATGGSAVYGEKAMVHLKRIGTVVYLQLSFTTIAERLGDLNERGVAMRDGQDLHSLYEERVPLYEKYADIILPCENKMLREIVLEIAEQL